MLKITGYQETKSIYAGSRTLVYRAIRASKRQPVIIKLLRNQNPNFNEIVKFRNQYIITRHLEHPKIVRPLALERYGNSYVLVMPDRGAIALPDYWQQSEQNLKQFLKIAIQLAEVLHFLTQQRIIHKDIKPANIIIHPQTQQVELIDFSIASLLPKEQQQLINPKVLEGTLAYISPEQTGRMNRGIDYRTDFYSLGVTFFELLTGKLPFETDDPMELVHCHIAKQVQFPADSNVPEAVREIALKLMAKNAEDRYQSALGLKYDLEHCLQQIETTGAIAFFELGMRDRCDRFLVPEKLYGREAEVKTLLEAFERVANPPITPWGDSGAEALGTTEMMLVAGFPGIGKTAAINEVHKPIVRQRGYFIKGKFDQFNRNIPFFAFVQAFGDLMGQLLGSSDAELALWKGKILSALGENAQVIIDAIPSLERIIGTQPPVPELSGNAAQNRFNLLFGKLVRVFTTKEHPLVIFLDDLQWADSASLNLLKLLMGESDAGYLLVLGAYRDNEVFPTHPLMLTLDEIQKQGATINTLSLDPLDEGDITRLVADTLLCSTQIAAPLSQLVYQKTRGNPFFTTQFLRGLYEDSWIVFDAEAGYWQCNLARVRQLALTDDAVQFMMGRLQKLPPETQKALKLAACIGNQFDLATLTVVCEETQEEVAMDLWPALQEGFVVPESETYKFFQGDKREYYSTEEIEVGYQFLHDRIQQAAYSLISQQQKQSIHLQIGQRLLHRISVELRGDNIFTIVNQLNMGSSLIDRPQKREELARLNLVAGRKAKLSTAYISASQYFAKGIDLLADDSWSRQPDLTLDIYWEQAETLYLNGKFEESYLLIKTALARVESLLEKAKFYNIQIVLYTMMGNYDKAIEVGRDALSLLSVKVIEGNAKDELDAELQEVRAHLGDRPILSLVDAPLMVDPKIKMIVKLLTNLGACAYFTNQLLYDWIGVKVVSLSLQYGHIEESARGYYIYAILLVSLFQEYQAGYQVGMLALRLSEKLKSKSQKCKACNGLNHLTHWVKPITETLQTIDEGFQAGLESGELQFASYNLMHKTYLPFSQGANLTTILVESQKYLQFCEKVNNKMAADTIRGIQLVLSNLTGLTENLLSFDTDSETEVEYLFSCQSRNSFYSICRYLIAKSQILYLYDRPADGLRCILEAEKLLYSIAGNISIAERNFYYSLCLASLYNGFSSKGQLSCMKQLSANQQQMKIWADNCPENFLHKYLLVAAEIFRISGNITASTEHYELAIAGAKANGFIQEEALANELAAKFYLDRDQEKIATDYIQQAYYSYAHWGAKGKTDRLEMQYPQLLAPILQHSEPRINPSHPQTSNSSSTVISTTSSLDFEAVIKASQVISEEIALEALLSKLIQVILENAGANKGALALNNSGTWEIVAQCLNDDCQLSTISLDRANTLPHSVINTVKRTQRTLLVNNIEQDKTFTGDPYFLLKQPKSLLCTPIFKQGELLGILYLENHLAAEAFTPDRIEVLNLLTSQAAISIENARLYSRLEDYSHNLKVQVEQRTRELQEKNQYLQQTLEDLQLTQAQLIQAEKMSSLGQMVAGIAHEINNPVSFIKGNLNHARGYIRDLLDLLAVYEQNFPNSSPAVKEKVEEIDLEYLRDDLEKIFDSMQIGSDRIGKIILGLRNFSRLDESQNKPVDIHEGLENTLMILQHRLESELKIAIHKDYGQLPLVNCCANQLNQVFMNILTNAVDAFADSEVGVSSAEMKGGSNAEDYRPEIRITTQIQDGKTLIIGIADNGPGMSESVRQKVFDLFFTTKPVGQGTGLGLSICYQIITKQHQGRLYCTSELGKGTEFIIEIPLQN